MTFCGVCVGVRLAGILAGRKQTSDRNYSYEKVLQWFAPRCDIILLMFDAHKVDISDEFRDVIKLLEGCAAASIDRNRSQTPPIC